MIIVFNKNTKHTQIDNYEYICTVYTSSYIDFFPKGVPYHTVSMADGPPEIPGILLISIFEKS